MDYIFLIGDSHIACLAAAIKGIGGVDNANPCKIFYQSLGGGGIAYDLFLYTADGKKMLNPILRRTVKQAAQDFSRFKSRDPKARGLIVFCVGGYISSVYTWDKSAGSFYFTVEGDDVQKLEKTGTCVPKSLVAESLALHFQSMVEALGQVAIEFKVPMLYVPPPPPYRHNSEILKRMAVKRKLPKESLPQPMGPQVRLKVGNLSHEVLKKQIAATRIAFLDIPKQVMDAEGCLLPEYYGDGFHANDKYGRVVLREILTQVKEA